MTGRGWVQMVAVGAYVAVWTAIILAAIWTNLAIGVAVVAVSCLVTAFLGFPLLYYIDPPPWREGGPNDPYRDRRERGR